MKTWAATMVILSAASAAAYDQKIHVWLSKRSYAGPAHIEADQAAAVNALRELVWKTGSENPQLKQRFLLRYPDLAHFDAWEWKRFLGLNPDKNIAGLDDTLQPAGDDAREVFAQASRLPDDDHRNRARFRHDPSRKVMQDSFGKPLPEDPATLEMGSLDGLSSQAHAHYGLPKLQFSDDPEVLKKDPRRFAIPPTVHTFGADYAEMYTELAVLAQGVPGGARLSLVLAGAAAHHIQDVANQIHTVQVGIYDFFVDAKIESIKEDLRSVGGLLRARPTFVSIGIDIIANYHTLLENLFSKHLFLEGDLVWGMAREEVPAPGSDIDLEKLPWDCIPGFGRTITEAVIERSSYEGARVYAQIREMADRSLSRVGHHYEDSDDPDRFIRPNVRTMDFYALELRGTRRADRALTEWWKRFDRCRSLPTARFAEALIQNRLDALDAADSRTKAFVPKPPTKAEIAWWVPALYAALLAIAYAIFRRIRRKK